MSNSDIFDLIALFGGGTFVCWIAWRMFIGAVRQTTRAIHQGKRDAE